MLISDFNVYLLPQSWSMNVEGTRRYSEILYRNTDNFKAILTPQFDKAFRLNRQYGYRHNLTKSLRMNYSANAQSFIPEPEGAINNKEKKNQIWDSLQSLGRLNNYQQSTQVNYDLPINKIPFLDFINVGTSYTGTYSWQMAFPATPQFGNTISNSSTVGANSTLNFTTLYNKSKYLKNIISGRGNAAQYEKPKTGLPVAKTPVPKKKKKSKKGKKEPKEPKDTTSRYQPGKNIAAIKTADALLRVLTMVRSVSANYNQSEGMALPGFMPQPKYIGLSNDTNKAFDGAPGLPFVFGFQEDIRPRARENGWITRDTNLSSFYMRSFTTTLGGQATLEPIKGFRIALTFNRRQTLNTQENFRFRGGSNVPESFGELKSGSFSITTLPIKTAFSKGKSFNTFERDYRRPIAIRLAEGNPTNGNNVIENDSFPKGYKKNSQDVLMYAFLAAYTGKDVDKITLNPFPKIPMPNWSVNYSGLTNSPKIASIARNITITHGYSSTYTIGNFVSSLPDTVATVARGLKPEYIIDNISLTESFQPLLGIDITWLSGLTTKAEYKKSRNVSLAFTNYQINETRTSEVTFGAGYRTNKLLLPFRVNRKKVYLKNDLTFRTDISIRDNINEVKVIDQGTTQSSAGQRQTTITPNIDYMLSKSLQLRIFWNTNISKPYVSTQYPTSNTRAGFSLRYTLTP